LSSGKEKKPIAHQSNDDDDDNDANEITDCSKPATNNAGKIEIVTRDNTVIYIAESLVKGNHGSIVNYQPPSLPEDNERESMTDSECEEEEDLLLNDE